MNNIFFTKRYKIFNLALSSRGNNLKLGIMKKLLTMVIMAMVVTLTLGSCGSTSGGCDAYGSASDAQNSQDLAVK